MNELTKIQYEEIVKQLQSSNTISEEFAKLMHQYYLVANKEAYNNRNRLVSFEQFNYYFNAFLRMPITYGNTMQQLIQNMRGQNLQQAIKNTIAYFNNYFNKNNTNFVFNN